MKWRVYLCSVFFVFLGLFVGSFIINQENNAFAVSDYSVTFSPGSSVSYIYLCGNNSGRICSDYSYLVISQVFDSGFSYSGSPDTIWLGFNHFGSGSTVSTNYPLQYLDSIVVESLSPSLTALQISSAYNFSSYLSLGVSVTLTLTDTSPFGFSPSGSISITENGSFDVSSYAEAVVNVPDTIIYGDYHDDLLQINHSIIIGCAVILCIYFFYCIYRMLLKGRD